MFARMRKTAQVMILALVPLLATGCRMLHGTGPYRETTGKRGWHHPFLHAEQKTPERELAYADQLMQVGRTKKAMKQYLALTIFWPESAEAGKAQLQYAKYWDGKQKWNRAFDEYQRLFDKYIGTFAYDEVLQRQFDIATYLMNTKKGRWMFFPGFTAPERAIPLFEKILGNGPQWEKAPEVQYLMGRAYELSMQYEEAIQAYMTTHQRYPQSAFADKAAFGAADCFYRLAQESPNNEQTLEGAWAAMTLFLNAYPNSDRVTLATEYRKTLYRQRAKLAFEKANYYDLIAKKPRAALLAYQSLVKEFPQSNWTELAQIRIDALSKQVGPIDAKKSN
jgi:outer membrane protein assembly factor BamD (BamD/ComL family)